MVSAKRHALAARRESVGHTQETLAEYVGVEPTTVGRWERGETSPLPWCRPKLADGLAISVEALDSMLAEGRPAKVVLIVETIGEPGEDLVLSAPWNHRGTVESAVALRGGDHPVKRRGFVQWLGIDRSCASVVDPRAGAAGLRVVGAAGDFSAGRPVYGHDP